MRQPVSPSSTIPDGASSTGAANTQLRGRQLIAARVIWVAVAVTVVALNILALPGTYPLPMSPDILRDLHRLGILPIIFVIIYVLENAGYTLVYLTMGILIFWRRSDDRMALFCSLMLMTFGGVAANSLDDIIGGPSPLPPQVVSFPLTLPLVHLLVVVGQVSFVTFFYLFPSGRFVPRWTRWCALLAVAYWLTMVLFPALENSPVGSLLLVFFITALIAQVHRYRRISTPTEREQAKWVVFGFVSAVTIIVVPMFIQPLLPSSVNGVVDTSPVLQNFVGSRFIIGLALVPIFIAIAITRSRLWAIDLIINRTLVYGSLTTILAVLYFACVVGAQTVSQVLTGPTKETPPVVIVFSTLLIAALFQPLRRRLQAAIDRRFYRAKYDAATTLARFGTMLRSETDLDGLTQHLVEIVDETMRPAHTSLWLRPIHREDKW